MVRRMLIACVVLAPLASLRAQETRPTTAPAEPPEVRPFRLVLRIVDKETREPLVGVKVRYIGTDAGGNFGDKGVTDDVGLYLFELPTNKLRHLGTAIRMDGYIPMGCRWAGTIPEAYTLEMERGQTIGGTVVDDAGQPIVGARVTLTAHRASDQPNARYDIAGDWVKTGEGGAWTYDRVPAGFTGVAVSAADPRYVAGEGSSLADVRPEFALAAKIALTLHKGRTIAGVVVDERGVPVAEANVHVATAEQADVADANLKSARDGAFQATVVTGGAQRIVIEKDDYAPQVIDPAALKDDAEPARVTLARGRPMRVRVVDGDGKPIANAWVIVNAIGETAFRRTIRTDLDGVAAWPTAPAEELRLDVMASGLPPQMGVRLTPSGEVQTVTLGPAR